MMVIIENKQIYIKKIIKVNNYERNKNNIISNIKILKYKK